MHASPRARGWAVALPAVLLLTGCPKISEIMSAAQDMVPRVQAEQLLLDDVSFEEARLTIVLQVDNPHPVAMHLDALSWALAVEGSPLLDGTETRDIDLAPSDSTELRLPVALRWDEVLDVIEATRGKGDLAWTVDGYLGVDTPVGAARVPFARTETLPAPRAPGVRVEALRVERLDLLGHSAALALDLGVENHMSGDLRLQDFAWALELAGHDVARGQEANLASIAGESASTVTLPIELDLLQVGTAVVELLGERGPVDVHLGAQTSVGTPLGALPLEVDDSRRLTLDR